MVYLPGPFSRPVSPFPVPVDPPATDPFDAPFYQVCINKDWLPYIAGALKVLWLQSTFNLTDVDDILAMQGKVANLISAFNPVDEGCGAITPSILCLSGTFADLDYGYVVSPGMVCDSVYVPGTGFQSCTDGGTGHQVLNFERDFSSDFILTSFEFRFNKNILSASYDILVSWIKDGVVVRTDSQSGISGAYTISATGLSLPVDRVELNAHTNVSDADEITADDWKLCYVGAFPLSTTDRWEHVFDFTIDDGGFSGVTMFGSTATYVVGTGWQSSGSPDTGTNVFCTITHGDEGQVVHYLNWDVKAYSSSVSVSTQQLMAVVWGDENGSGGFEVSNIESPVPTSPTDYSIADQIDQQQVWLRLQNAPPSGMTADGVVTISRLHVVGFGFDPFA